MRKPWAPLFEPYALGLPGVALWKMVYFKG